MTIDDARAAFEQAEERSEQTRVALDRVTKEARTRRRDYWNDPAFGAAFDQREAAWIDARAAEKHMNVTLARYRAESERIRVQMLDYFTAKYGAEKAAAIVGARHYHLEIPESHGVSD